jgi:hypothetical protein
MALLTPQSVVAAGTTPTAITPTASDTIPGSTAGPNGWFLRVITTGTASTVKVLDPTTTQLGNPGTVSGLSAPATGARMLLVPRLAADPGTGVVTITSTSQTGMTYELYTA